MVDHPWRGSRWITLDAEQELGRNEHALDGHFDSIFKATLTSAGFIEGKQHLQLAILDGLTIRASSEPCDDFPGTRNFSCFLVRMTTEYSSATRAIAWPLRVKRTADLDAAQIRISSGR